MLGFTAAVMWQCCLWGLLVTIRYTVLAAMFTHLQTAEATYYFSLYAVVCVHRTPPLHAGNRPTAHLHTCFQCSCVCRPVVVT